MSDSFAVFAEGLTDLEDFETLGPQIRSAASKAVNTVARNRRAAFSRQIRREINLPASYVGQGNKNLYVAGKASPTNLQAKIVAAGRPTSLARYVKGSPKAGKAGVYIEVAPGKARFMKRAFMIKLPQGSAPVDTKYNMGLAIRLRKGERLQNKVQARKIASGLYLLYGPSVDQVFLNGDGTGIARDAVGDIQDELADEFFRLMEL